MSFGLKAFSKLYIKSIAYLNYYTHFDTWNVLSLFDYSFGKSVFQTI